jgi:hypothetical protein
MVNKYFGSNSYIIHFVYYRTNLGYIIKKESHDFFYDD